jgi:hypothetical protein
LEAARKVKSGLAAITDIEFEFAHLRANSRCSRPALQERDAQTNRVYQRTCCQNKVESDRKILTPQGVLP